MLTYEDFINELRPLVVRGQALYDRPSRIKDPDFRRWNFEVIDLIDRTQSEKYAVNCSIASRSFASYGGSYTGSDKRAIDAYNLDLKDTINELEILIQRCDVHGAPNPRTPKFAAVPTTTEPADKSPAAPINDLQPPKQLTLDWIWRHMPVSGWVYILGGLFTLLGIAFTFGVKLGPLLKN
jgi:hypothetical protein